MAEEHTHRVEHRTGDRITEMWAWVSIDPEDDNEGIIAHPAAPGGVLLGADEDRIRCIQPLAEEASAEQGIEVKLVRFTGRQEVESIGRGRGRG